MEDSMQTTIPVRFDVAKGLWRRTAFLLLFCMLAPVMAAWEMVWNDEFDGSGLPNSSKWGYDVGGHGWGNNELQYYTSGRTENARVGNGVLTIEARKENYEGKNYTSARLVTKGKGDWLYGRFVIRAKLPSGRGTWPAIWMLPTDWLYGGWPDSGELDIMEHVGYDHGRIHCNIHTKAYNHMIGTNKGNSIVVSNPSENWHEYIMEWNENRVTYWVDQTQVFSFANERTGFEAWPFDKRFHLILNIAVGGNWGGAQGVDDNIFPTKMEVDYVRVYRWTTAVDTTGELVRNGNFSQGSSEWSLNQLSGGVATGSVQNGVYELQVSNGGSTSWALSLVQGEIYLQAGRRYTLSFDASASASGKVDVGAGMSVEPFTTQFLQSVQLSSTMKRYSYTFTAASDDPHARLFFDLGQNSPQKISIDNVSLIKLDPPSSSSTTPQSSTVASSSSANLSSQTLSSSSSEDVTAIQAIDQRYGVKLHLVGSELFWRGAAQSEVQLRLYGVLGKELKVWHLSPAGEGSIQLPLELPPGRYLISWEQGGVRTTQVWNHRR